MPVPPDRRSARGLALVFGALNLASAALVAFGVFSGLPDRYWPVDAIASGLTLLFAASGVGLLSGASWSVTCTKVAAGTSLAVGLALVCALALTASYLAGIYGPVGRGGSIIFVLVLALVIPYLVAIPVVELLWLGWIARSPPMRASGVDPR